MNPWTQVAIERLRQKRVSPLREPVQVLGEAKGLGQSRIVALAHPGTEFLDRIRKTTRLTVALVVPVALRDGGEWALESSRTVQGYKSPSNMLVVGCINRFGIWLTLGTITDRQVYALRLHLRNEQEIEPDIEDQGFLLITEMDPRPFQVTLLSRDNQVLEQFPFPPYASIE